MRDKVSRELIVKNIDLEIYERDFTVVMGASGSGKSTLLYMLSGMDRPSLGRVFFRDEEISGKSNNALSDFRKNHCGFVFQQINLIHNLTVLDNVVLSGLLRNKNNAEVMQKAKRLLSMVNIEENNWDKSPSEISGGEAQRVAVVRAEINEPDILFADEPTGALNSESGCRVLDLLSNIHQQGRSVLMVTHDFNAALRGNRILYLKDGVICGECNLGQYIADKDKERIKHATCLKRYIVEQLGQRPDLYHLNGTLNDSLPNIINFSVARKDRTIVLISADRQGKVCTFDRAPCCLCIESCQRYRRGIQGNHRGFLPRTGHFLATSQNQCLHD